jgi:hypothetical protein
VGVATVRTRDAEHDGQAEAGTVAPAALIRLGEALERGRQERLVEAGAVIGDVQLDAIAVARCAEHDRAGTVTERVVHEVGQYLIDAQRVGANQEVVGRAREQVAALRSTTLIEASLDS